MENLRRSYEISVWTLQDSFITVLKPSNLQFKGQIIDPLMNIKDDGENKLSLKIPMYIRDDYGKMIENPLWHNTKDGTIIIDLRKLKVIFNKATTSEEVFEFLITNMKEEHEGLKKYCEVECEGLAFHELGKQGYRIALEGGDEIEIEQKKYFDGEFTVCPQPTINYWADKVFKGSNWRYSIQMDWSAHDGITHQKYTIPAVGELDSDNYASFSENEKNLFNNERASKGLRRRDRVYEDSFVSAWEYDEKTNKLAPKTVTEEREKYRLVEASESNRYNLSQTIAETFQVYCKYKYYYDDNYHIVDREVIFYNNFLNESQGTIDLTYKYNTEHLTRIMDAADTVSKMYVRPLNDGDAPTGQALISDADANKSKEDYLLNFDYLYNIGTITQEQYDEIEPYYIELRKKNKRLIEISEKLIAKEKEKIKQEARKQTAEDAIALDTENISNNDAIARNLGDEKGNIHVTADNPQILYLIPERNNKNIYYCTFKSQGIVRDSIHLYWQKPFNNKSEITQYNIENDEFGEVSKIVNINKGEHTNSYIYATFNYSPNAYFKKVSEIYGIRLGQDQAIVEDATKKIEDLETAISNFTDEQNDLLEQKAKIIDSFERMMGPALREGTWQPEDEYSNYGEVYEKEIQLTNKDNSVDGILSLGWDNELFDNEQELYYQYGATLEERCYPCIKITENLLNHFANNSSYPDYNIFTFLSQLNLIYGNTEQRTKQYIAINSKMKIAFLRNKDENSENYNEVTPVLMITDATTMGDPITDDDTITQLQLLEQTGYLAYIKVQTEDEGDKKAGQIIDNDENILPSPYGIKNLWLIKPTEITNSKNYEIVYPRFKIDSPFVKSPYTMITVKRQEGANWELLANYENFYILPRTNYYTVTIKPEAIFLSTNPLNFPLNYKIYYTISMSPLAIYLDAVQVLKENSFPKVSYEIDVMSVNEEFVYNDYSRLGQIAHINDYEFRFENTLGYISELDLDLDKPWQDKAVIKNYKTKFEDIFSTIVAQTEQMKKNSATIAMAASAFNSDGTLSSSILGESLMSEILTRAADNTTDGSVPSPATEFMKYDPLIRNELRQTYNEAGKVLAAASKSVEDVIGLNLNNADILGSFQANIANNVAPSLFRIGKFKKEEGTDVEYEKRHKIVNGIATENAEFKMGDFLEKGEKNEEGEKVIYTISVYTAVQNSSKIQYDSKEEPGTSMKGWAPLKNGKLAVSDITGASIDMDAEAGRMEILAGKQMNLLCGGNLNLLGGESVVIGGPDVTIFSGEYIEKEDGSIENPDLNRGVHIFATRYNPKNSSSDKAAVDITGNGIEMRASQGINFISSNNDGEDITVISLSKDRGIYLGSNQPIRLFSGASVPSSGINNASVEISNSRILFGVTNGQKGNAVDITKDYIIFGSSFINESGEETTTNIGSKAGGAGVKITQTSIQMATGTANTSTRNYINMNSSGIIIANADNESYGSYVKVSKDGVLIGANTATQQQNLINDITGTSHNISYSGARFQVYAPNFCVNSSGTLYAYNANISGTIHANYGTIGGWEIDSNSIYAGTKGDSNSSHDITLMSTGSFSRTIGETQRRYLKFAIGDSFGVDYDGWLYASHAEITGSIFATDGSIGGWTIGKKYITTNSDRQEYNDQEIEGMTLDVNGIGAYSADDDGNSKYFNLSSDGGLKAVGANIEGTIEATDGSIGGWYIRSNYLGNGDTLNKSSVGFFYREINDSIEDVDIDNDLIINNSDIVSNSSTDYLAFWVGSNQGKDSKKNAPFRVYTSGYVVLNELRIKEDLRVVGEIKGKIKIGGSRDSYGVLNLYNKDDESILSLDNSGLTSTYNGQSLKINEDTLKFIGYVSGSLTSAPFLTLKIDQEQAKIIGDEGNKSTDSSLLIQQHSSNINLNRNNLLISYGNNTSIQLENNTITLKTKGNNATTITLNLDKDGLHLDGDIHISGKYTINGSEIRQFPNDGIDKTCSTLVDMDTFKIDFDQRKWSWEKAYKLVFRNGLLV